MNSRFKLLVLALAVILCACSRRQASSSVAGGTDMAPEAKYLTLIQQDDCVMAEVSTPWSGGKPIATYRIDKPLERSVVFSSVYTAAIDELGAIGCVAGVADGAYFVPDDTVARLMANGRIADVGSSMSPMVEKIIDLDADAVLVSAMEGGASAQLVQSGIPVIYLADYLEETPLARAEWIKFIGLLYGRGEAADSVWNNVRREYTLLRDRVANVGSRPVVLTEKPMSGVWYVPGGHSYMARLIADAGGKYPWDADTSTGSLPLDEGGVIDRASEADVWLIKDARDITASGLLAEVPHAKAFKAYPAATYFCNTVEKPFFNSVAFHPERVLRDYAMIFHPEKFGDAKPQYFEKIK